MAERRVVVTGLGVVSPLGLTAEETWRAACAGQNGVGPISLFDASTYPVQFAAEVKGFSPERAIESRKTRELCSRPTAFGVAAAKMAWQDAGLTAGADPDRCGIIVGSCLDGPDLAQCDAWYDVLAGGVQPEDTTDPPLAFLRRSSHAGAALVAAELGLRGPVLSVYVACASGSQAIAEAAAAVRRGAAEVLLSGGFDSMIDEWYVLLFSNMYALSTRNSEPSRASRPFDKARDGFVMGEGAGLLVLEELEHARARGVRIYAEVIGFGASLDAYRVTDSPPNGEGAAEAMSRALIGAGICRQEVDYINAHGTSTRDNDVSETKAVKTVFGEHAYRIPISSTKSMMGHLISAAGGVEAAIAVLALRDGVIPPTINHDEPDVECDLDYVPWKARRAGLRVAMSNSFGFGGSNASVVFRRWEGELARPAEEGAR
jgi:3-oxoacyl-[acyl-carrier-protein] synthase II